MTVTVRQSDDRRLVGLHMTPLIDVVFQLIIFFMIGQTLVTNPPFRVDVPDPHSSTATLHRQPDKVTVHVSSHDDGTIDQIAINDTICDGPDHLERILTTGIDVDRGFTRQVVLRADGRLDFGQVRGLLDILAGVGADVVYIAAEQSVDTPGVGGGATP